jgi:nitrogen fixation protein NifU and related proteins
MSSTDPVKARILDHYTNPRNKRWLEKADIESHGSNPTCGDDVLVQARLDGDTMKEVAFSGRGCAISQAAASMLTELALGKNLEWVERSSEEELFRKLDIGEHRKARVSCELLGIRGLKNGVLNYRSIKRTTEAGQKGGSPS